MREKPRHADQAGSLIARSRYQSGLVPEDVSQWVPFDFFNAHRDMDARGNNTMSGRCYSGAATIVGLLDRFGTLRIGLRCAANDGVTTTHGGAAVDFAARKLCLHRVTHPWRARW